MLYCSSVGVEEILMSDAESTDKCSSFITDSFLNSLIKVFVASSEVVRT
jgi:hypothetical protein